MGVDGVMVTPAVAMLQMNVTESVGPTPESYANKATFGLTGLLVFVIVVIIIIFAKKRCIERKRRRHSDSAADSDESFNEQTEMFVKDPFKDLEESSSEKWKQLPDNVKWMLKGHIIDNRKVRLGSLIGKGETVPIGVDSGGQPGHAPPIIKMGSKPLFCPPIIRR